MIISGKFDPAEVAERIEQLERELVEATRGWPKGFPLGSIKLKDGAEMAVPAAVVAYCLHLVGELAEARERTIEECAQVAEKGEWRVLSIPLDEGARVAIAIRALKDAAPQDSLAKRQSAHSAGGDDASLRVRAPVGAASEEKPVSDKSKATRTVELAPVRNPYSLGAYPGRPDGCEAELWFSPMQGPCHVCVCGANSPSEERCKHHRKRAQVPEPAPEEKP